MSSSKSKFLGKIENKEIYYNGRTFTYKNVRGERKSKQRPIRAETLIKKLFSKI